MGFMASLIFCIVGMIVREPIMLVASAIFYAGDMIGYNIGKKHRD